MEENEKNDLTINSENNVNQQKTESEIKFRNKNLTIVLVLLIIVLILAIGVCAGLWFAGDTTKIINNKEEVVKEEENTSKKIDETKPWVYDAQFNKETKTIYGTSDKSYFINSNECLKVPYININSEDAKKVNEEIEKLYEECYLGFGKLLDEQSYWKTYQRYDAAYNFYENENILSVVLQLHNGIVVVNGGAGGGNNTIYTYNFDLETLKLVTLDEMASICGFNSGNEVTNKITTWENNQYNFVKKYPGGVAATFEGVSKGKYFIDSNGKLNFVYKFNAASSGDVSQVIEPNMEIEDYYDMSNVDESQAQKSIFDKANSLKYTSNPKDNINGKIAVLKIGERAFQTVMHDGYYTYTDNFSNSYNIKEIIDITSEYIMTGNDNWANLFKCTVKYLDNNNKNKSFDIAVIVPTTSNEAYFMAPYDNYTGSTSFVKGFTDLYSYDYINEYFTIELPANWEFEYNVEEETLESGRAYTFMCKEHNKMLFKITVLTIKESEVANFEYIGTDGKLYYYLSSVVDGDVNSEHYDKLFENFNVLDSFYLVKTIKNEYGNGTQTKTITGKDFITIPGTSNRGYIYYIDRENNLCKTSLFDGFETKILANYVKNIELNSSDGEIHAYPIGDSFMNNIVMEDEFVVFENVN